MERALRASAVAGRVLAATLAVDVVALLGRGTRGTGGFLSGTVVGGPLGVALEGLVVVGRGRAAAPMLVLVESREVGLVSGDGRVCEVRTRVCVPVCVW